VIELGLNLLHCRMELSIAHHKNCAKAIFCAIESGINCFVHGRPSKAVLPLLTIGLPDKKIYDFV